jgi:RNA polymerase sigma-70 factor (ECF subfamily)
MGESSDVTPQPASQESDSPEAVYRREWRPLYGLIYRAVRRRDDAHDLTQEVFARALPTLDRAPPGLRIRAFLNTIARNLLRDRWRRRSLEFVALDEQSPLPDHTADLLDQVLSAAERDALRRALATLPADYRRVLHLRIVEGRPMPEVAVTLGRKPDAVRQLQHRALVALRDRLREETEQ